MPEFRARINAYADDVLEPDHLRPRLRIDGPLSSEAITHDLVRGLDSLGPFGMGNPRPVFHASPVEIVDGPRTLKERHLKMTFSQDGRRFRAIAWRAAERAELPRPNRAGVNLAFSLDRNEYQGETYLELNVCDVKRISTAKVRSRLLDSTKGPQIILSVSNRQAAIEGIADCLFIAD